MGFGAIVTSGDNNNLLRDDLVSRITEVRVEQSVDDPTRFAIRLEDDICGGDFEVMHADDLQCGVMMAIAVSVNNEVKCLVRGPITDAHSSFMQGGSGSWYEVRGEDRRIELDRQYVFRRWSGRASEAAQTILSPKFQTDIEQTTVVYGSSRSQGTEVIETLNQRFPDATFVKRIAQANNLHFWIEYDCRSLGNSLIIGEKANVKSSPPRAGNSPSNTAAALKLAARTDVTLQVNVSKNNSNVTSFSLKVDGELPNRFSGLAIEDRDVAAQSTQVTDPQPPILKGGQGLPGNKSDRDVSIVTAGNQGELQTKAQASLTEGGWFLNATASTTVHKLCGVVLPHDVIEIDGLGDVHSGPYQVTAVTHVINAADHFMDIKLRRNAVGKK